MKAIEEPPSLVDLRGPHHGDAAARRLPEVILEVMSWVPELGEAFTAVSGGRSRLKDLPVSIAACLTAHSLNVGYRPIARRASRRWSARRLSHVYQNYFRPETLSPANAPLVARRPGCRWPRRGAAAWSPRSTGCGSSSPSRQRSPAPTASTSAPSAA